MYTVASEEKKRKWGKREGKQIRLNIYQGVLMKKYCVSSDRWDRLAAADFCHGDALDIILQLWATREGDRLAMTMHFFDRQWDQ